MRKDRIDCEIQKNIDTFINVGCYSSNSHFNLFSLGGVGEAKATATYGNATAADILSGKTATMDAGQGLFLSNQ